MYILRRTQGADRDVIELIADRHLGSDAKSLRNSQKRWKMELSKNVNSVGIEQAVKELKNLDVHLQIDLTLNDGCQKAQSEQVSNHISIL